MNNYSFERDDEQERKLYEQDMEQYSMSFEEWITQMEENADRLEKEYYEKELEWHKKHQEESIKKFKEKHPNGATIEWGRFFKMKTRTVRSSTSSIKQIDKRLSYYEKTEKSLKFLIAEKQKELSKNFNEQINNELKNEQRELSILIKKIKDLTDDREQMKLENKSQISDHAIIRYLERIQGINIDSFRDLILTEDILNKINFMVNGEIKTSDYTLVVKNKIIVTLKTLDMK